MVQNIEDVYPGLMAKITADLQRDAAAAGQLTLGKLLAMLRTLRPDAICPLCLLHSYRGFYVDLALSLMDGRKVSEVLKELDAALGTTIRGYKGGDYVVREDRLVWVADYQKSGGGRLLAIHERGNEVLVTVGPYHGAWR